MEHLPRGKNQANTQGHSQLPQMRQIGKAEFAHHMMEPNAFMHIPMFDKQNEAANQIAGQSQHHAPNQCIAENRISNQIHIGKAI